MKTTPGRTPRRRSRTGEGPLRLGGVGRSAGSLAVFALAISIVNGGAAAPAATLAGEVLRGSSGEPIAGARVYVADPADASALSSVDTSYDGRFRFERLDAARYELAVEHAGRLYVVRPGVVLGAGEVRAVRVAISDESGVPTQETPQKPPTPDEEDPSEDGGGMWSDPLKASALVAGGAIVLGVLIDAVDDDETTASPSDP